MSHGRKHRGHHREPSGPMMIFIVVLCCIALVVVAVAYYISSRDSTLIEWELHLVQAVAGVISAWRK